MSKTQILMQSHILNKKRQVFSGKWSSGAFCEAAYIHGTDIGDVGESFIRDLFTDLGYVAVAAGHNEYDILLTTSKGNLIKIEIKTAKEGRKNTNYQFDGIDPRHNAKYTILLGISNNGLYFNYFVNNNVRWDHDLRAYVISNIPKTSGPKKLVSMNPNNEVNMKLTLNRSLLYSMNDCNIERFLQNLGEEEPVEEIVE